jgi:hypothetical protein
MSIGKEELKSQFTKELQELQEQVALSNAYPAEIDELKATVAKLEVSLYTTTSIYAVMRYHVLADC